MRTFAIAFLVLVAASTAGADQLQSYVFSRGDHRNHIRISHHDWPVGFDTHEPGFWFSYGDRNYVIRDAATLAAIEALFAPEEALEPQMRDIESRMRGVERRQEALEHESERLEHRLDAIDDDEEHADAAERRELEAKIREIDAKARVIERELEPLEREEEVIDQKEEQLEREAERQLEPLVEKAIRNGIAVPRGPEAPRTRGR